MTTIAHADHFRTQLKTVVESLQADAMDPRKPVEAIKLYRVMVALASIGGPMWSDKIELWNSLILKGACRERATVEMIQEIQDED